MRVWAPLLRALRSRFLPSLVAVVSDFAFTIVLYWSTTFSKSGIVILCTEDRWTSNSTSDGKWILHPTKGQTIPTPLSKRDFLRALDLFEVSDSVVNLFMSSDSALPDVNDDDNNDDDDDGASSIAFKPPCSAMEVRQSSS